MTDLDRKNGVSAVVRVDEESFEVSKLNLHLDQEIRLVYATFVFQLLDICLFVS